MKANTRESKNFPSDFTWKIFTKFNDFLSKIEAKNLLKRGFSVEDAYDNSVNSYFRRNTKFYYRKLNRKNKKHRRRDRYYKNRKWKNRYMNKNIHNRYKKKY